MENRDRIPDEIPLHHHVRRSIYTHQTACRVTNRNYPSLPPTGEECHGLAHRNCGRALRFQLIYRSAETHFQRHHLLEVFHHTCLQKSACEKPWVPAAGMVGRISMVTVNVNVNDDLRSKRDIQIKQHPWCFHREFGTTGPNRPLNGFLQPIPS